jgi:cytosine/adenosine deaminase-related metal-dependent hydrolase
MSETLSLRDASVQDIQLELLRRTKFNEMTGERVVATLLRHRDLWMAVLLDRQGTPNFDQPGFLLNAGLIKLRDLPKNIWNADTLFILTQTHEQARELARLAEAEDWFAEVHVYENQREIDGATGTGRRGYGLLSAWWD